MQALEAPVRQRGIGAERPLSCPDISLSTAESAV
jgi:hypothetical protein